MNVQESDSQKITITSLPYKSPIRYIYHISDIHIHLYKRHDEYQLVFNRLYDYLRSEKKRLKIKATSKRDIPAIVIITGDILHSKSDLSPECIAFTYKFFKDILDIMPLVVIPGNHDLNMNNKERLDSLTAIICDLPLTAQLFHLNNSGVSILSNLVLSHASIFDYNIIDPLAIDKQLDTMVTAGELTAEARQQLTTKIILYHGRVNGVELFNGTRVDGELSPITKKTITPSNFAGYDLALLGDIHKHQFIDTERVMAYAGSLIQQNLGEDIDGHGLLAWDIETRNGVFVPIKNDYGYVTVKLVDGNCQDNTQLDSLPPNIRLRLLYSNCSASQIETFIQELKTRFNVMEYSCQSDDAVMKALPAATSADDSADADGSGHAGGELNVRNIEYQNKMLEEIILESNPDIESEDLEAIKQLNKEANKLYFESDESDSIPNSFRYKLRRLEFDNMFSYGTGNVIDFTQCKGVVGIVAPNHMGKSSILDIILFALFDEFTRKGSAKDMINIRRTNYRVKLVIESGIWRYTIEKSGEKSGTSVTKSKCLFTRRHMVSGREENLQKDTGSATKQYIKELFGDFNDMVNTNFSIQNNSTGFIDATSGDRRAELERILKLDFFTELYKRANEAYRKNKTIFEHYQKTMPSQMIIEMQTKQREDESRLKCLAEERTGLVAKAEEYQAKINQLNKEINPEVDERLNELLENVDIDLSASLTTDGNSNSTSDQLIKSQTEALGTEIEAAVGRQQAIATKIAKQLPAGSVLDLQTKSGRDKVRELINSCLADAKQQTEQVKQELDQRMQEYNTLQKTLEPYKYAAKQAAAADIEKAIETAKTSLAEKQTQLSALKKKETALTDWQAKVTEYTERINRAKSELEALLVAESVPSYLVSELTAADLPTMEKQIEDLEGEWSMRGSVCDDMYENQIRPGLVKLGWYKGLDRIVKTSQESNAKMDKIRKTITDTETKFADATARVQRLQREITGIPKLESEIDKTETQIAGLESDLVVYRNNQTVNQQLAELMTVRNQLQKQLTTNDAVTQLNNAMSSLVEYEAVIITIRDLKQKQKALGTMHDELDTLMKSAQANLVLQVQITETLDIMSNNDKQLAKLNGQIELLKDQISSRNGVLDKLRQDCIDKTKKEKLMYINDVYKEALRQIPMVLINRVQPILERKVNDLLNVITNFSVRFEITQKDIGIYLDRPAYNGRNILINNSSGFERFISSLAIRLALMQISQLPSPNFMAIDEGWSCFDNENIANMDVILDHLCQRFDFLLTISHLQVIRQHCDIQITLRKDAEGFSGVTYG